MPLLLALTVSDGSITGTIAYTEDNDTAALAGTSTPPTFSSTITYTEGNDTGAFAGSIGETGTLIYTEASDAAALAGGLGETGILAAIEGNDTAAFSGSGGDSPSAGDARSGGGPAPRRRHDTRPYVRPKPIYDFRSIQHIPDPVAVSALLAFTEADDTSNLSALFDIAPVIERDDEELLLLLT